MKKMTEWEKINKFIKIDHLIYIRDFGDFEIFGEKVFVFVSFIKWTEIQTFFYRISKSMKRKSGIVKKNVRARAPIDDHGSYVPERTFIINSIVFFLLL